LRLVGVGIGDLRLQGYEREKIAFTSFPQYVLKMKDAY
jgi:hypothetical protein